MPNVRRRVAHIRNPCIHRYRGRNLHHCLCPTHQASIRSSLHLRIRSGRSN